MRKSFLQQCIVIVCIAMLLGACSGGGSSTSNPPPPPTPAPAPTAKQASRFLAQASFGPNSTEIDALTASSYSAWIDTQFTKPAKLHRTYMDSLEATLPSGSALTPNHFSESFWQQAVNGDDQLRQRVTFALSEIFVISLLDSTVANYPKGVASYYDMLAANAFGNFRDLLEGVSLHPMMGIYLTSLRNQKESGTRVPDENYAREVMQLFTIGLYELNLDGSHVKVSGKPIETYTGSDISGLAKVFTGWSWAGPDKSDARFYGSSSAAAPERQWQPMQSYPKFHSASVKNFLGVTVPVQSTANPEASLKIALDRLFAHKNAAPFFARHFIQRLTTSNPSSAYIARVSATFENNGQSVRGDMKAVIKAVLLDSEARADFSTTNNNASKLREPIVRLANWMRAFQAQSASTRYLIGSLDDPLSALGQTPMRSPSVFNFYRPGYVPPNTSLADASLVAPEFQITAETSVVGYLNFIQSVIPNGVGTSNDVKGDYTSLLGIADTPASLIDKVDLLLTAGNMSSALRTQIFTAVSSVTIPTSSTTASDTAKKNRVYLAIYLTMASPEYLVQQ